MALPDTIPVKISSEAAGYISLTAVVARQMPVRELVETMLAVTGPDHERIRELLRRGSIVSGASRFRWTGFEAAAGDIATLVASLPAADPARPFVPNACTRAVLRGPGVRIEIPREVAERKRLLRRGTFWELLMDVAGGTPPRYVEYSYGERADRYSAELAPGPAARIAEGAGLLRYSGVEAQLRRTTLDSVDFLVPR
ncbi:MAG TPA: hypothetical protein VN428_09715 [Bryobacteraceae bacterium]|nr:hypothetical protein [Bryobacteraceae bacterium]